MYLDDLFNSGLSRDWALIGTGVRPTDAVMREELLAQDWLTTVVEQEADHSSARVTASMIDFIDPVAWPAFNVADSCIVVGVFLLLWVVEGRPGRPRAS